MIKFTEIDFDNLPEERGLFVSDSGQVEYGYLFVYDHCNLGEIYRVNENYIHPVKYILEKDLVNIGE